MPTISGTDTPDKELGPKGQGIDLPIHGSYVQNHLVT